MKDDISTLSMLIKLKWFDHVYMNNCTVYSVQYTLYIQAKVNDIYSWSIIFIHLFFICH